MFSNLLSSQLSCQHCHYCHFHLHHQICYRHYCPVVIATFISIIRSVIVITILSLLPLSSPSSDLLSSLLSCRYCHCLLYPRCRLVLIHVSYNITYSGYSAVLLLFVPKSDWLLIVVAVFILCVLPDLVYHSPILVAVKFVVASCKSNAILPIHLSLSPSTFFWVLHC